MRARVLVACIGAWLGCGAGGVAQESIEIHPKSISLDSAKDRHRIVVVAKFGDDTTRDVTAEAELSLGESSCAKVDDSFALHPIADGEAELVARFGGREARASVRVSNSGITPPISFANEVMAVLTRSGCNAGTCHGSAGGKNGFHLSLFGYDKAGDHIALTRELRGRRANVADPEASLLLTKPSGVVPHKGGKKLLAESADYALVRDWIEAGAGDDLAEAPNLVGLVLEPEQAVLAGPGQRQRLVVTARYSDGTDRDVTSMALMSSSNELAATVDADGVVSSKEAGESFVMARFGTFALVTQVLVLNPDREFSWPADVKPNNYVDVAVFAKLRKQRILPSKVCDDETFLRRVYLDIVNVLPTPGAARRFLASEDPQKRAKLVDELLQRPEFPSVWAMQWAEVLRVEPTRLEDKGMFVYNEYLRDAFENNKPIDELVRELLTSEGGNFQNPASNFYLVERSPRSIAENVAQIFMGVRIQCAQCHNHPFERWTMDDYYGFAAFFAQVTNKTGEDPRERVVFARGSGDIRHPVTNRIVAPKFLGGAQPKIAKGEDPRESLAQWITSPDNEFFAINLANRVFARFFGRGLVEPPDDVRVSNPPSHPELHRTLGAKLVEYGYDLRRLIRDLCASRTYQVAAHAEQPPASTFAGAPIRRLTAEQLLDAIGDVAGVPTKLRRLPLGARATEVPSPGRDNRFLQVFGRPARESSCTCDRRNEPTLSQVLHLINGKTTTEKLRDKKGRLAKLLASKASDEAILEELYLAAYSRTPDQEERARLLGAVREGKDRKEAWEDVFWAVLNSREFLFNH